MIARLSALSRQGQPTVFHQFLRTLDDRGQLLRVYTQNIDALEMKAGLSFGVPEFEEKKLRVKLKGRAKVKAKETGSGPYNARLGGRKGGPPTEAVIMSPPTPPNEVDTPGAGPSTPSPRVTPSFRSPAGAESHLNVIPRCIPLHGTLLTLHCQHCTQSFPLEPPSLHPSRFLSPPLSRDASTADFSSTASLHGLLALGRPPPCPSCTSLEQTRALVGKRLRGVGKLRPSVVLYGEEHREGEGVGEAVRRDLCGITHIKAAASTPDKADAGSPSRPRARAGKGPDLLLVVGTSLRVPGTKRIVREFSKAVRPSTSPSTSRPSTPAFSPATDGIPSQIRTVYLNFDFPLPARDWEGVFDVWVNGDAQAFARAMAAVIKAEEENKACEKQGFAQKGKSSSGTRTGADDKKGKRKGKRKAGIQETPTRPAKRRKVNLLLPPTPVSPPRLANGRYGRGKDAGASPHKPTPPRVILRLPPSPSSATASTPRLKRKRSIPKVVITSKPTLFFRNFSMTRSLSPLTCLSSGLSSLSSLTPMHSPCSSTSSSMSSPSAVGFWRDNVNAKQAEDVAEVGIDSEPSDDDDVPLAVTLGRRAETEVWYPPCRSRPPLEYTYGSRASCAAEDRSTSPSASG